MSDQPMLPAEYTAPITRTRTERAAFLCRTPEEIEELDALADLMRREQAAAPRLAARLAEAGQAVSELHHETVRQRRRIDELEVEAGAAVGTAGALRARVLELEMRETARNERIAELEAEVSRLDRLAEVRGQRAARADSLERALREDREEAAAELAEQAAEIDRLQALADRRWVAWHSARQRAEAYGEGIIRHVEERNWAVRCLQQAEFRAAAQADEIAALRAQLAATTRPDRAGARLATD